MALWYDNFSGTSARWLARAAGAISQARAFAPHQMGDAAAPPQRFRLADGGVAAVSASFARSCSTLRALRATSGASDAADSPPPLLGRVSQRTLALLTAAHAAHQAEADCLTSLLRAELLISAAEARCAHGFSAV